jgi:DNA ligase-1
MTLYQIIKALQAQSGKGSVDAKKSILEANKDNALLQAYLKAVYDPSINYYIKKLPAVKNAGTWEFSEETIEHLVNNLSTRQLTGKNAAEWLKHMTYGHNAEGQELIGYLIKRDIRASVGESTILDVFPGLFFVPPYQRCATMKPKIRQKFAALPTFYVQKKADGSFAYGIKPSSGVPIAMTRSGNVYPLWVAEKLTKGLPEDSVLVQEMLVYRNGVLLSRKEGNGILNSILQADEDAPAPDEIELLPQAWDLLTMEEFIAGKSSRPYQQRWHTMLDAVDYARALGNEVTPIEHHVVASIEDAYNINSTYTAKGEEGTVWKNPDSPWYDTSSGNPDEVKVKVKFQAEYEILDTYEGEGKAAGMLGGITVGTKDRKIISNCGSGFDDDQRKKFWAMREQLKGAIVTIEANDIVQKEGRDSLSLFLPIFIEIRLDRKEADSYDRCVEQLNAAKEGK